MNKIIGWILSFTKLGKIVQPVQGFLSGKKAYLAGAAVAIPAILTIIQNFAEQGMPYLLSIMHTVEWDLLMNGLAIMGLRAAISKAVTVIK